MIAGQAPMAVAVMWALSALTAAFVGLRLYTRAFIVRQLGWDDHVYALSGLLLVLYTAFTTVAAAYGFGQPVAALALDDAVQAVKWEMVGQSFAVLGMAVAKASLGAFLLRLVLETWHRALVWAATASLLVISLLTLVIFWVQCIPPEAIFDPRVSGRCIIGVSPFAVTLGAWCAFVDFFFAGFPWLFIWKLNMKHRDKVTIAGSMSLGVIAGVCGIIRTIELGGLSSRNYTEDTVNLIIWSAAELAVTMICIGIPVLGPLYRRVLHGSSSGGGSGGRTTRAGGGGGNYYKHGQGTDTKTGGGTTSHRMRTLRGDGSKYLPEDEEDYDLEKGHGHGHGHGHGDSRDGEGGVVGGFPDADPRLGISGPSTVTYVTGDHESDEDSILGPEFRQPTKGHSHSRGQGQGQGQGGLPSSSGGIRVREDVRVEVVETRLQGNPA